MELMSQLLVKKKHKVPRSKEYQAARSSDGETSNSNVAAHGSLIPREEVTQSSKTEVPNGIADAHMSSRSQAEKTERQRPSERARASPGLAAPLMEDPLGLQLDALD